MEKIAGIITILSGIIGTIGSALAIRFSGITIIVMTIIKLVYGNIHWFAGIFSAGAISTGLWMLFGGLIIWVFSIMLEFLGTVIVEEG